MYDNSMIQTTTLTASEARDDLYSIIKLASKGIESYQINLRGADPVVLMNKEELDSWLETADIMNNPKELKAIRASREEKGGISHQELINSLGLNEN